MSQSVALTGIALLFAFAPARAQIPSMDALWPNDDGRAWTYVLHREDAAGTPTSSDATVRLLFDGMADVPDGLPAQYLRQQALDGGSPATALASAIPDPLLGRLWIARPDLRTAIRNLIDSSPCPVDAPTGGHALLLNGEFAVRKAVDDISAWRCFAPWGRSWQWLAANLAIGSSFTLQLIPDLADDIFLHGTVGAIEPANVPAGPFAGCVRVDYVVDFGQSTCTDADGNTGGTTRSETRGYVRWAPGVGPVESFETFGVVESSGSCGETVGPISRASMRLTTPPVPVARATWGRLKATYR